MTENDALEIITANPKPKILILGGIIGALMGLGAAYLFIQRAEREEPRSIFVRLPRGSSWDWWRWAP